MDKILTRLTRISVLSSSAPYWGSRAALNVPRRVVRPGNLKLLLTGKKAAQQAAQRTARDDEAFMILSSWFFLGQG